MRIGKGEKGFTPHFPKSAGFTLIELAIVLVIIGIILGAVLKGQDLIAGARAKKFATWGQQWEASQWTYFDRKGRFAGDGTNRNGLIGDVAGEQTSGASAVGEILAAGFINTPTELITLGSFTFCMRMGIDPLVAPARNVIAICCPTTAGNCATACTRFASDELLFPESFDTAIDGIADAGLGNVRGATAITTVAAAGHRVVTDVTEVTATAPWATTHTALVYYFDRPR
ncbi:MAG: prepilin-type N-terminal cleavage/methylation domain-containing protein [Thermodesulfovibrionales bacterium]|nr:prepilin-type N-terminal cleavage/methylation domain-containing protein [Thermodesulfovibrionales bacterium]